jgi:GT2 family glycosyltransferase
MLLAIILPVHNHLDLTENTLQQINTLVCEMEGFTVKFIVVDDGSTDGTSTWVARHYPGTILLQGDGNLWWSGAVNRGAAYAFNILLADYILLWNNDIVAGEGYFGRLGNILPNLDGQTIIGSKVMVYEKPSTVWSMGGCFNPRTGVYRMRGYYEPDGGHYARPMEADWLTGMGTVIPRSVIETIGYWDNVNFPQYHGDSDFTYRARQKGFRLKVFPELVLFNKTAFSGIQHSGSIRRLFGLMTDIRSKTNFKRNFLFYRKHARSIFAYLPMFYLYVKIFGGFVKWKMLHAIGIQRS